MTRTQNSFFNVITGMGSSLLLVLLNFITRSVFINTLGVSYQGLEGIFSNILSMLSLTELGFGTAISFKLYKPIEEDDRPRMRALLNLYRQVYFIIGCVIAVIGLALIPFLPVLIKDYGRLDELGLNAVVLFLVYLFNSVSSYWFFAYKNAFVTATQKSYVLTIAGYAVSICSSIAQILVLIFLRDFLLYVLTQVIFTILRGLLYALIFDKRHPYLRGRTQDRVAPGELKGFFKDCGALFIYRINSVVVNSTDNLVLSSMLGLDAVGLYYTYSAIKTNLHTLLYTFLSSIQASLGSLYSTGNLDWSRLAFRIVQFCVTWLYGVGAIGFAVLANEFIPIWMNGRTDLVVTTWTTAGGATVVTPVALLIGIEIMTLGMGENLGIFRSSMGLFQQMKYRPIASIIVNLVLSIVLVPCIGIAGCVVSTIVSFLTTTFILDPIILFKYGLKESPKGYYVRTVKYTAAVAAAGVLSWWLCSLIPLQGIWGFLVHGCVCVAASCAFFTLCFFRTTEFRYMLNTVKTLLPRRSAGDKNK